MFLLAVHHLSAAAVYLRNIGVSSLVWSPGLLRCQPGLGFLAGFPSHTWNSRSRQDWTVATSRCHMRSAPRWPSAWLSTWRSWPSTSPTDELAPGGLDSRRHRHPGPGRRPVGGDGASMYIELTPESPRCPSRPRAMTWSRHDYHGATREPERSGCLGIPASVALLQPRRN